MGAVGLRETGAIHVRESNILFEKTPHEYSIGIAPNVFINYQMTIIYT